MRNLYECYNSSNEKITEATTDKFMLGELVEVYQEGGFGKETREDGIKWISGKAGINYERLLLLDRNNIALDKKSYRELFKLYAEGFYRKTGSAEFLNLVAAIELKKQRKLESEDGIENAIRSYSY